MSASQPNNEAIFHAARDIPDADRRRDYVRQSCGGDAARIALVEALLAAADTPDSLLDRPGSNPVATIDQPAVRPGSQIGPYKLLQQIGEGGFGVVYMAEQLEPVRRKVAVKVIKPGMDTRQVIARFEAERQALALMDHPNIARVLDAGTTDSGRPYFVMELVRGIPITQYSDENSLPIRERLELFATVCQAIQHAHTKGIIHRDIKPTNVLVTRQDGAPVVKVIDFGVAKAMGQQLTEKTLFTEFAQMIGTPLYMSPEQAELSSNDIDTRSDIYSLGVLLYELLTGSTPVSKEQLKQAAFDEIRRIIREDDPPKPSTRLSESSRHTPCALEADDTRSVPTTLASIAAVRSTEPAKLTKLIRGELDWIVMKALEKDRSRRYETANGFAADIERYLADEQVLACPPSKMYRFSKFARRNRTALATAAGFAALLLVATAVSAWLAVRANVAEQQAKAEAQKARTEAAISRSINEFIRDDLLGQAGGRVFYGPDSDLKLRTVLDRAAARIEGRFRDQPLVEAALRQTIGYTYLLLDYDDYSPRAAAQLQRAADLRRKYLGEEHRDTLMSEHSLAVARKDDEALRRALDVKRRVLGPDDPDTLLSRFSVGKTLRDKGDPGAIAFSRETLAGYQRTYGEGHPDTAYMMHFLAHMVIAGEAGPAEVAEADRLTRHALAVYREKVGSGNWPTWNITVGRGQFLRSRGRFEEAEAVFREEYEALERLPSAPPEWSTVLAGELVEVYRGWGKSALAAEWEQKQATARTTGLLRKADLINERPDDPDALQAYGLLLFEEAAAVLQKGVQLKPDAADAQHTLAHVLGRLDKFPEAEAAFREAIRLRPMDAGRHHNFGDLYRRQKKYAEAEAEYREAMRLDPKYAEPHVADMLCREVGDFERGVPVLKELIRRRPDFAPLHDLLEMAEARQGTQAPPAEPVADAKEGDPR
jgi:eukaryotic-like serine/threonine-protein kinase